MKAFIRKVRLDLYLIQVLAVIQMKESDFHLKSSENYEDLIEYPQSPIRENE